MKFKLITLLLLSIVLCSNIIGRKINYRDARNKNVCKVLKGDVLVYCIFVDTKTTLPWTEYDIKTTIDSLNIAVNWLNQKARTENISLQMRSDYYIGNEFSTIKKDLPEETVEKTIKNEGLKTGIENLNKWADFIAKKAGISFNMPENDGIPEIKNPKNKERLIAYLRDQYKVESVALLFMVNNYYKTDISIHLNTMNETDVEYAIVGYKYSAAITHSILNLFGASDLFDSPYRNNKKSINFAKEKYPNEIMLDPYAKKLENQELSSFTKYLIGWNETVNEEDKILF